MVMICSCSGKYADFYNHIKSDIHKNFNDKYKQPIRKHICCCGERYSSEIPESHLKSTSHLNYTTKLDEDRIIDQSTRVKFYHDKEIKNYKLVCKCGSNYTTFGLHRHMNSMKHQNFINFDEIMGNKINIRLRNFIFS